MKKKTATIIDNQIVWKNLKKLKGESFLLKLNPKYKGNEYVIENNLAGDITVLKSDNKGEVLSWSIITNNFIEDEGYEIK